MIDDFSPDMSELETVEDFFNYFQMEYEPVLVQSKRIQILRLFRHILTSYPTPWMPKDYKKALKIAYNQMRNGNELAFAPSNCHGCSDCDD
ncbi:nitrogenase-stabilizing/protective protein NifW [Vibrio algarum]|uniref:Nitrogenase-stabilizing/protective protein NifW n=1 Tax=Vibrio algarum TaxID=3020714 RepID=A0ABT4YRH2_9VIBR|nr:nitrogenase-stabilizing/protective protein NifW [Vibrio sp. KJ40-1]MDB1124152.1 nitrogenase-stabilizing/protective protein NifW [Vibrio sp. KJ40-1]